MCLDALFYIHTHRYKVCILCISGYPKDPQARIGISHEAESPEIQTESFTSSKPLNTDTYGGKKKFKKSGNEKGEGNSFTALGSPQPTSSHSGSQSPEQLHSQIPSPVTNPVSADAGAPKEALARLSLQKSGQNDVLGESGTLQENLLPQLSQHLLLQAGGGQEELQAWGMELAGEPQTPGAQTPLLSSPGWPQQ